MPLARVYSKLTILLYYVIAQYTVCLYSMVYVCPVFPLYHMCRSGRNRFFNQSHFVICMGWVFAVSPVACCYSYIDLGDTG